MEGIMRTRDGYMLCFLKRKIKGKGENKKKEKGRRKKEKGK